MLTDKTIPMLSNAQYAAFSADGFLPMPDLLTPREAADLAAWVDAIAEPAREGDFRLHYFEDGAHGRVLCRTERFIEDHTQLADLITQGPPARIASALLGEQAMLYKEKVNYKAPGGAGFAPHQDATAYAFAARHVTCLLAVDSMSEQNGCLHFSPYGGTDIMPGDGGGCLDPAFAETIEWRVTPAPAGGAVFFTSHAPHRSAANLSPRWRRALYLTYNALSAGDHRPAYYAAREQSIEASNRTRISVINHFQGRPIP